MKFTPAASIFTTAWPASGLGSGTSSRRSASGPPGVCTRIAFMTGNLSPPTTRVGEGEFHMKVGFIGLGSMGLPIARHVLQAGHTVVVYNRTRSRADALKPLRPTVADSPAAAARGAEVLVTMLADDAALEDVMLGSSGALPALARGAIHMSMSTISPKLSRALAERHRAAGQEYVAAPVFGRPIYENYGKLIADERYEPAGFKLRYGLKDVRLALGAAEDVAAPMPLASLIRDRYLSAVARGWGDIDWAGLARIAAADAGLTP